MTTLSLLPFGTSGFCLMLMSDATHDLTIGTLDTVNCFQSTNRDPNKHVVIHTSPFYMTWFRKEFPPIKLDSSPSSHFVMQLLKGLQGKKSIGRG